MVDERQIRQPRLETALIFAAWSVFGLIMANQFYMQAELSGRPASWGPVLRHAQFEAYLWAFVTLALFWLARRYPFERGRMLRRIPVHLVAAVVLALLRVVVMVETSRHVEWLGERSFNRQYHLWFHNYLLFCVLLVGIAHAVLYYGRYRERERAAQLLAAGLTEARLPHLMLQPLVENAIRHGIAPRIEPGRIEIVATRGVADGWLHLHVRDDGVGMDREGGTRTRKGVGLTNIQSRLEQLYDGEHRFELANGPEGGLVHTARRSGLTQPA